MDVRVGLWRKLSAKKLMLLKCGVGEDSWESLGLQGDPTSPSWRRSVLGVHWKDWCWSWNSSTSATWCEELTDWKRPWCWEGLRAGGEGDDRGWDGWMASLTRLAWVWVNSRSWWWTERPGVLRFMASRRVRHNWVTELNWTELKVFSIPSICDKLAFEFCHNSLGRRGSGNILLLLQLNDFRRQESNSFISSFLHSVCSNFELTVTYLIRKSLPSCFDMLYPAVFNFKFLSHTVNTMYFFPPNFCPIFN